MRLPPRGPNTPISDPTLLIVTEDHWVHLTYIRFYLPGIRFIKRHLPFTGISTEMGNVMDVGDNSNNTRRCIDAAIGIGYNGKIITMLSPFCLNTHIISAETSVFIATHSSRVPPPTRQATSMPSFNSMDLSVPVDLTGMNPPDQKVIEWDNWGEERTIELFEVTLRFDGSSMGIILLSHSLSLQSHCAFSLILKCCNLAGVYHPIDGPDIRMRPSSNFPGHIR